MLNLILKAMKTKNTKWIATTLLLAVISIAIALPANAQRRRSDEGRTENPVRKDNRSVRNTVQKKSTFKDHDSGSRDSKSTSVRREREIKRDVQQKSTESPSRNTSDVKRTVRKSDETVRRPEPESRAPSTRNDNQILNTRSREKSVERKAPGTGRDYRNEPQTRVNRNNPGREEMREQSRTRDNRGSVSTRADRRNLPDNPTLTRRNSATRAQTIYKLDDNDKRYRANSNYKGSNEHWSNSYRSKNNHYRNFDKNFYRNYNYGKYNHWDHRWENYRWNHHSWIDYYHGYHPYSYKFHRHYFHHPTFGHVIRRFVHRPDVFFHNNHRFYCYDGHFFRYFRGVGYVLVDIPFGMVFSYLPHDYDRVFINGYLYFRVGNLFFEYSDYGYRLVHYPERYFAYSDDFYHEGYVFDDILY
jgi:hypothetical protein